MRFTGRVPLGMLAILLTVSLVCAATVDPGAVTKEVSSATASRTILTMNFDETAVLNAAASLDFMESLPTENNSALLAIAGSGTPQVRVLSLELGAQLRGVYLDERDEANIRSAAQPVVLGEPAVFHDLRVVSAQAAPVVRDESGALRVVRHVEFAVETFGTGGVNTTTNPQSFSSAFEPVYRSAIDNLDEIYPDRSLRRPGRLLVLLPTQLLNELAPVPFFTNWIALKELKGYEVLVRSLVDVDAQEGDSAEADIRDYIRQLYLDSREVGRDLEFVVLMGDVSGGYVIPSRYLQNPEFSDDPDEASLGDNFYFAIDGEDFLPDIFGGRISAQVLPEFVAYLSKAYNYETNPPRDETHWFESATFVAGNYADGQYPVTPVWNTLWCREVLMNSGCITDADTFFFHDDNDFPGQWTSQIANDIEAGVCAVFYRGWANQIRWIYPTFTSDNVEEMEVNNRNPAVFAIVCGSADYEATQCMGEVWTTGVGSVANPNGAIIYYGASDLHTNTRHNNAQLAAITRAVLDGIRSGGALAVAGKLEVFKQFPLEGGIGGFAHYYGIHVFNLLGDPELQLYICQPGSFNFIHPEEVTAGSDVISLTIQDDTAMPVANAIVSVRDASTDEVFTALSDENGLVELEANLTGGTAAELLVWKATYFQDAGTFSVNDASFNYSVAETDWDTGGDGMPSPGESVNFMLTVENLGEEGAPTVTITSDDERVNVTSGTGGGTTIPAGGSASVGPFTLELSGSLPDGSLPVLNVEFADGSTQSRELQVPVYAPDPQIYDFIVNDGDGVLAPGETAEISVRVINRGSLEAPLSATVTSFDNAISITDGDLDWPVLTADDTLASSSTISATIPGDVTPGRQIVMRFAFSMNGETFTHKLKLLTIGVVDSTAPTGPDTYGYYAYENIDTGFDKTPAYDWVELNPDSGGTGGTAHDVHDDTHFSIQLPTPFTFYGESYDSLWICSNGWISFEYASLPEFRNWEIPSPIGPPSMVCAFWDDLIAYQDNVSNHNSLHYIWTRNDGNRFIIQWQTLNRRGLEGATPSNPSTDYCTFEVILEYTGGGDGDILCQYKQLSNVDSKDNYGTVGIQNSDHLDGLGLTYANMYPASVGTLNTGRAIRFTTTPPDNYLGANDDPAAGTLPIRFALHPAFPNPFNPTTEMRFDLPLTAEVSLRVYDILGREAAVLLNRSMTAGSHSVSFNAANLPSGLYFARLTAGTNIAVQKLMLVK